MPHSGGGGSHSGGSHSGGGSRSGGGGSSKPRISKSYFSGSSRYVYYWNHKPVYYYAVKPYEPKEGTGSVLVFGLIWLMISTLMVAAFIRFDGGGRLPLDYDNEIVIDDGAGMIDNSRELVRYLEGFREESGVTVCVVTRNSHDTYLGNDCEKQAYNCYVERWDDESHWLIYYVGDRKDRSDDWNWNLMCGDDCVRVLSYAQEDKFTESFHRYLVASSRYSFEECIIKALSELEIDTGKKLVYRAGVSVNGELHGGDRVDLLTGALLGIFPAIGLILVIFSLVVLLKRPSKEQLAKKNAYKMPSAKGVVHEDTCEYCDGVYVVGTVISCPHCGAPIKAHNTSFE